ncbi:UDP-N-acetylmuramoyl-L-alanyl-D-glutamate synthetase [Kiloniella litopenaei]|uniref:UDP-N-acetylmuramoylalanine--D-glutamate ligase n=1 Tax=Kiloniella litopenaei TaxID=1549748 RepID=A0A0M2R9U3_9PROT|nr:UDP-N-acetylmuramoyl-L-alanine--D-glutamate ligase [Kiloniella litopenaei]KKJ78441.1 UDP-N-acetylmuramoyl-L-alanyl-D-glutamate synthetase [Kiloniella litopenaei]
MIDLSTYISSTNGKAFAVLGLGRSGLTAACALAKSGAKVWAWDDNPAGRKKAEEADLELVDLNSCDWNAVQTLVMSPGIPLTHPSPHPVASSAIQNGVEIICEVELLYRAVRNATFIGITGTNGKSTTTSLIAHILTSAGRSVAVGGNLGTPALELPQLDRTGIYVLEMSSYQLDLLSSLAFDVALFMNISPDHLDRHGDIDGYIKAKKHIFERQTKNDTAIIGMDDDYSRGVFDAINQTGTVRTIPISGSTRLAEGIFVAEGLLIDDAFASQMDIADLSSIERLPGNHNHQNAAAAFAACRSVGLTNEEIITGMKSFPGLAHRQELAKVKNGIRYINDSKATNADAAARALSSYDNIYWIAGGRAKEGGIESLSPYYPRIRKAYLIGESADAFAKQIGNALSYEICGTLDVAVTKAANDAAQSTETDPVVLLSPACASWDQYRSFELRGDHFKECVEKISHQPVKEIAS